MNERADALALVAAREQDGGSGDAGGLRARSGEATLGWGETGAARAGDVAARAMAEMR